MENFLKTIKSNIQEKKYSGFIRYIIAVLALHIIGIALLITGVSKYPQIIGMAVLSYTLGLRHAFDADHITAIDNTVRKLVQERQNPKGVGFLFSFGHSTVVIIMAALTVFAVKWTENSMPQFQKYGGAISLAVSGSFLLIIGLVNLFMWKDIFKTFLKVRKGTYKEEELDYDNSKGFINKLTGIVYKSIRKGWHVYILGFLFGLGFDTATQVSLLATSATAASHEIPILATLSFPILFTAGMSLMDTADGFFMCTAYEWVFSTPIRKIYYNLTITGLSVIAALFIGFIEIIQMITPILGLDNEFCNFISNLDFNIAGYILVGLFIVVWGISYAGWKILNIGEK
ncbi:HoxN/HupN/NixA family nickel/cobalt transporter [Clostridium sp. YIM B02565]|uniref:Nickel/cobalt efflux system n=1 Tax=Clostridium paridis TaxID=2803863 RepID=A0A937K680_9CLOT|nr:HoxN/HupN/NixA family nickel/cobalt transporter [Clostridium paridis]MBL4933315.1 HoxN/HupN/NixA family nickel/cobalt transporter [Clostridium paridis]